MKITTTSGRQRKAISPIIATVLIIAVTLIAAVAIGGFVFGLFGASSNTAQVSAVNAALTHPTAAGTSFAVACAASAPASTSGFIQLSNSGSANTVVTSFSLTYGGNTYSVAPSGGTLCTVTAGSTIYMTIVTATGYTATAATGQQYTGFAVTANGAQVVFTGAFA